MGRPIGTRLTYTVEEAAVLLGISKSHAYRLIPTGDFPAIRFGGRLVVPKEAVRRLLQSASIEAAGGSG